MVDALIDSWVVYARGVTWGVHGLVQLVIVLLKIG